VRGVRLEASEAMGRSRDGNSVRFAGRLLLLLDERAVLVFDRVELPFPARVESRLHTFAEPVVGEAGAMLQGKRQRLSLRYAADQPAILATAIDAPTSPLRPGANLLRWCSRKLVPEAIVMATLMLPDGQDGSVAVASDQGGSRITVHAPDLDLVLRVDARLHLVP